MLNAEAAMFPFIRAAAPGAYWVNVFPSLKYIPDWMPGAHSSLDSSSSYMPGRCEVQARCQGVAQACTRYGRGPLPSRPGGYGEWPYACMLSDLARHSCLS